MLGTAVLSGFEPSGGVTGSGKEGGGRVEGDGKINSANKESDFLHSAHLKLQSQTTGSATCNCDLHLIFFVIRVGHCDHSLVLQET
jgi:hypothetical protein